MTYIVTVKPHELDAMRNLIIYARVIAQTFPDQKGDMFAAKLKAYAQMIEDVVARVEVTQ